MAGKEGMHRKLLNPAAVEVIRHKIDTEKLIKSLQDHVFGNHEMSASQISAATVLLKKSVPDLSSVEMDISGSVNHELHLNELK